MLSFRQKIIITYILVFLLFVSLTIPFATRSAALIMYHSMEERANEIITFLQASPNEVGMIATLKENKPLLFYRVTLINKSRLVLYDTHTKRLIGGSLIKEQPVNHPEVIEALKDGVGYHEEYSYISKQDFAYLAKVFYLHGEEYVLRISFPLRYVNQITREFKLWFIFLATLLLLLYSMLTWIILNHLTKPIQKIIQAITPYQEGKTEVIPEIAVNLKNKADEFVKLGYTLNSLSKKIQHQIDKLISERKEKELVLETLVEGVVAIDSYEKILYANTQALKFFQISHKSAIFSGKLSKIQATAMTLLRECQKSGETINEIIDLLGDGGKRFFNLIAVPMKEHLGAILVIQDQTSQLRMVEMKRDFVANASHELRTPITIIQGFAETLQQPSLTKEQVSIVTEKIIRNCEKLTTLIKELLLLSDIENIPHSKLEPVDLVAIVEKCQESLKEIYPQGIVQIITETPQHMVVGNPSLLERALLNLMDNGLKYSPEVEKLQVTINEMDLSQEVVIKDFGIGMSKVELEQIFNRFYRSDLVRQQKFSGSGLGLAIVETIITKHHGKIFVTSEIGKGTEFTIILPKG